MALRFIEYLEVDGNAITVYIQEEKKEGDHRSFRVQVQPQGKFDFILFREKQFIWQIITHNFPQPVILEVLQLLQEVLESRLEEEEAYLCKN